MSSAAEDVGIRVPFARNGATAGGSWRAVHTDSSAGDADGQGPGVEGGKAGKGKAAAQAKKAKRETAAQVLDKVAAREGEELTLSQEMMRLYEVQRPSPESIAARQRLIDGLTQWLNEERFSWGHPHNPRAMPLEVVPFGSMRFGLGTATSDLDLCLLDPYRPNGFEEKFFSSKNQTARLPDIYNMRRLGDSLKRANLNDVTSISGAAVPICKFKVRVDGHLIEADLNTNERLGVFNSRLINSYCNLHPLVRPLCVFVKFWAKQRGLNKPSGSPTTFSSYTLILLVIAYLQRLDLLPNLQDPTLIAQTGTAPQRFFSTPKAHGKPGHLKKILRSVGWDVTFVEYDTPPEGYAPREADLAELARGFFDYYGQAAEGPEGAAGGFRPEVEIVSVWHGAPLARQRRFQSQADADRARSAREKELERESGVDAAERRRQEAEDEAVAAFAAEGEPQWQQQEEGQQQGVGDSHVADLDALEQQPGAAERPDSRSSSPVAYEEYDEPERWAEHLLVVQDPFILTRNTAGNVLPDWVDELRVQMRRARDLIDAGASLRSVCAAIADEPDHVSVAAQRKAAAPATAGGAKKKRNARAPKPVREKAAASAAATTTALDPDILAEPEMQSQPAAAAKDSGDSGDSPAGGAKEESGAKDAAVQDAA
ncbi:hypothetical protein Rhopal_006326-T1 [Rhodotorula paludigena]|uniref:Poly(A) RNA polymerase mitochondrial-like central palm domain-containing protein n=1 Tax=Rhodotorula paludigena TaxID=86838 RepID=A0AAV5GRZ0_9BASI|nr:hypothetical protein Rhopal_006326-T1 [Rhodotorula paludigena]